MNLKTIGSLIFLAVVGWLGVSEAASAAKFAQDDTTGINIPTFKINAAGVSHPNSSPVEGSGGEGGLADALFGPTFATSSASNQVIDRNGIESHKLSGVNGGFKANKAIPGNVLPSLFIIGLSYTLAGMGLLIRKNKLKASQENTLD